MRTQRYEPSRRTSLVLLIFLTALAAWLRLSALEADSLWSDEAATWAQVDGTFLDMLSKTVRDNYPPLYNAVLWLFVQPLGDAEWVLRLPAALFGIALVPMVYLLGTRAAGRTAGLLAALLVALSAFHVWYSVEARTYSLLALAACAYAWAVLRDIDRPGRGSGLALIGTGLALLLSHPYGTLDWLAIGGAALWIGPRRRRLLLFCAISLAMFLPFALALMGKAVKITEAGFWIPEPRPEFVLEQFGNLTSGLLLGLAFFTALALVPPRDAHRNPALPVLLALAVVPPILGYLASLTTRPIFLDRYLIGSLPAILVLAAMGATRWLPGRPGVLAAAAVAAIAGTLSLIHGAPPHRQDWRGTMAYTQARLQPGDCVLVHPAYTLKVGRYYARDAACLETLSHFDEALDGPPLRHLFLAVESDWLEDAADEIARISARRPLVATRHFNRIVLYEFGAAP